MSAVTIATAIWLGGLVAALIGANALAVDGNYGGAVIVAAAGLLILAGGLAYAGRT